MTDPNQKFNRLSHHRLNSWITSSCRDVFLVFLVIIAIFFASQTPATGSEVRLGLERSDDLSEWSPVPLTPEMIGEDGRIILEASGESGFFRMRIEREDEPGPSPEDMALVAGGTLSTSNSLDGTVVSTFHIGRFPVTWGEWQEVRSWAANNGYDIDGIGNACQANYPVSFVSWYDAVKWCNARSEMEGLEPVYRTERGAVYRTEERPITQDLSANGYRLPQEAEWEFAAGGGNQSQGFTYSGSDDLDEVGWYVENSGGAECAYNADRGTWPVGLKAANELGLYDMSGNVWEWCWPAQDSTQRIRGGGYNSGASSASVSGRFSFDQHHRLSSNGFRLARNAGE